MQFHPEVTHTDNGSKILEAFIKDICECQAKWRAKNIVKKLVEEIRTKVGDKKVLLGISGGVDSSVAAALLHKAIGKNLECIFVDNGLLRKEEVKQVKKEIEVKEWKKKKDEDILPSERDLKTNEDGEYEFTFGVPVLSYDGLDIVPIPPTLVVTKEEMSPEFKILTTGNGSVLRNQPSIGMVNLPKEGRKQATALANEAIRAADNVITKFLSPIERVIIFLRSRVMSFATIIQIKLFPLAIQLMLIFGITKITKQNIDEATCPSDEQLKECIRQRNSIVRQLNQIYTVITANTILAVAFEILTRNFSFIVQSIENLSFPVAVPPGVGVPQSVLSKLESLKDVFRELGELNKELRKNLLISLIFLIISLVIILRYLKKLDALIERCSADTSSMAEINAELLALSLLETQQGTPEVPVVNNFQMSVEVVQGSQVDGLYRRQAIAKNSQGVILLRGEPSFSATDQVLIDELVFYIKQNNLKAD